MPGSTKELLNDDEMERRIKALAERTVDPRYRELRVRRVEPQPAARRKSAKSAASPPTRASQEAAWDGRTTTKVRSDRGRTHRRIIAFLQERPCSSRLQIADGVGLSKGGVEAAVKSLVRDGRVVAVPGGAEPASAFGPRPVGYRLAEEASDR